MALFFPSTKSCCTVVGLILAGCQSPVVPPTKPATIKPAAALKSLDDPTGDYNKLRALQERKPDRFIRGSDEYFAWTQERFRTLHDQGLDYLAKYPSEPRRWDVLVMLQYGRTHRMRVLRDGTRQLVPDEAERLEWEKRYYPMLESLLAAGDASDSARYDALRQLIDNAASHVLQDEAARPLVAKVLEWTEAYYRQNPKAGTLSSVYHRVATMLNAVDPDRCKAFINEQRAHHPSSAWPDPGIRAKMDGLLRLIAAQSTPAEAMWQQFQSFDQTLTDLAPYRGKVVLVAYLAVDWSSRTMELEELHRTYHAAGLEIIQVAYANTNQSAPPEQRDVAAMRRYVAGKQWPWRVVWDAKLYPEQTFWDYWGQNTVPAFILIGRDGCIMREPVGRLPLAARITQALAGGR